MDRPALIGAGPLRPTPTPPIGVPVRLRIPAISLDTRVDELGLRPERTLAEPAHWGVPGWYAGGPRPGAPGPAVIAGHVDSTAGPAVFFALGALRPGDAVFVRDRNGGEYRFVVDDVDRYRKDRFPTARVYGPQPLPVLRLITCTGVFDRGAHSYLDNLVVSAHRS